MVEMLLHDRIQGNKLPYSSIREHNIQATVNFLYLREEPIEIRQLASARVALQPSGCSSQLGDCSHQFLLSPTGDDDQRSLSDKQFGGGESDAARPTRDQRNFSDQSLHSPHSLQPTNVDHSTVGDQARASISF